MAVKNWRNGKNSEKLDTLLNKCLSSVITLKEMKLGIRDDTLETSCNIELINIPIHLQN
jgi:hypothetical protein